MAAAGDSTVGLRSVSLAGGLHVGGVELVDAGVEVADAADHGVLADELDGRGDGQGEEGEEEVHDFLAGLGEQHPLRLPVDEELHAQRGGGCGGCHLPRRRRRSLS